LIIGSLYQAARIHACLVFGSEDMDISFGEILLAANVIQVEMGEYDVPII
jgi:hypothetical protein